MSTPGLCWLSYSEQMQLQKLLKYAEEHDWIIAMGPKTVNKYDAIAHVRKQLDDGCAYVVLNNPIARVLVQAASDWERDSTETETIREKRKP